EAALVRRRAAARAARGARARAEAAGVGDDLRRRQRQDDMRDVLGRSAAHSGERDDGVHASPEDPAANPRRRERAREELARRDPDARTGDLELRLRRALLGGRAAWKRRPALPGHAADVGLREPGDHESAGRFAVHPAQLPSGVDAVTGLRTSDYGLRTPDYGLRTCGRG